MGDVVGPPLVACLTKFDDLRSVVSIVARNRIVGIRLRFQQTEATKEESLLDSIQERHVRGL